MLAPIVVLFEFIYVPFTRLKMEEPNETSGKNTIKQLKSVESSDLDDEISKDCK